MARLQNPESQDRYARYIRRFVCYCLRIVAADEELGDYDGGHGDHESEEEETGEDEEGEGDREEDNRGDKNGGEEGRAKDDPLGDARDLFVWQGD